VAVSIQGDGVAASCCAHLLTKAGFQVALQPGVRSRVPAILLGDQALALIREIFDQPALFADRPPIRRRIVAWGANAAPVSVEHSAVLVSEQLLLDALRPARIPDTDPAAPAWTIHASRPLPAPGEEHSFGSRFASAMPVTLREDSGPDACWIESLDQGWLFLVPGWLLAVGGKPDTLLSQSRVIAPEIARRGAPSGEFPAFARIASPLCAPGWLACGAAAMSFDPICGDGTAHAIREAILAAAVIRGIAQGEDQPALLAHYEARLTAGFRRHLTICRQFYLSGGTGELWVSELAAIDRGIERCDAKLTAHGPFRYQLRGFELEAVC
jgi:hypothetical protein